MSLVCRPSTLAHRTVLCASVPSARLGHSRLATTVGVAGRARRCTLTRASSNPGEDRASGADRAAKSNPPPQPSQPLAEGPTSDKFLPVVVVLAYAGLFSGFALAIDWGYIFSEVLGLGVGYTADDLDTAAMWESIK